ncbi:MAG TPA: inorganic diphosphatase [Polyangiaceae bacterium]|jgi:hypothetical protein
MSDLIRLPHHDASGNLQVVIEAPLGSTAKLKYDADVKIVRWERALPEGWAYPCAWGFIPSTLCDDGDPLDAGVLFEGSTWPGVVVPARAVGVLRVRQFLPNLRTWSARSAMPPHATKSIAVGAAEPRTPLCSATRQNGGGAARRHVRR